MAVDQLHVSTRPGQLCVMAHISGCLEPLVVAFPAAVGVHSWLCACVCVRSSCCSRGFDAEALLTCGTQWEKEILGHPAEGGERVRGQLHCYASSWAFERIKKWPPPGGWREVTYSSCGVLHACRRALGAVQLQRLRLTRHILCFIVGEKRAGRSEGCEQIRGWAHGKNIKKISLKKEPAMAPRCLFLSLHSNYFVHTPSPSRSAYNPHPLVPSSFVVPSSFICAERGN